MDLSQTPPLTYTRFRSFDCKICALSVLTKQKIRINENKTAVNKELKKYRMNGKFQKQTACQKHLTCQISKQNKVKNEGVGGKNQNNSTTALIFLIDEI